MDDEWINTVRFSRYCPNAVHLDKYDHASPFCRAVLTLNNHFAHVFASRNEGASPPQYGVANRERERIVLIRDAPWGGFCEGGMGEGDRMSYQGIGDV